MSKCDLRSFGQRAFPGSNLRKFYKSSTMSIGSPKVQFQVPRLDRQQTGEEEMNKNTVGESGRLKLSGLFSCVFLHPTISDWVFCEEKRSLWSASWKEDGAVRWWSVILAVLEGKWGSDGSGFVPKFHPYHPWSGPFRVIFQGRFGGGLETFGDTVPQFLSLPSLWQEYATKGILWGSAPHWAAKLPVERSFTVFLSKTTWTIHARWSWVTKYDHIVAIYEFDSTLPEGSDNGMTTGAGTTGRSSLDLLTWRQQVQLEDLESLGTLGKCQMWLIELRRETFGQERAEEIRHHRPGRAPKNFEPSRSKSLQAESKTCLPWTSLHAQQCKKTPE